MRKCTCKADYNISEADISIRSPHEINIHISREAENPTISSLRQRIEDLETFRLHIDSDVDRMLGEKIGELDLVSKAALTELLASYCTADDLAGLIEQERAYNDSRYDARYL